MLNKTVLATLALVAIGANGSLAWSDEHETSAGAVAKYLATAKVTLQQGLTAAESQGRPIAVALVQLLKSSQVKSLSDPLK